MGIKHSKVVTKPQNPAFEVSRNEWNDEHIIDDTSVSLTKLSGHDKNAHDLLGIDSSTLEGSTKVQVQNHVPQAHDHDIYVKTDGTRPFTSTIDGITPTETSHLTTKGYVDALLQGLDWQQSVLCRYDPTSGLPPSPPIGIHYISTATANGWFKDQIYEWNGSIWKQIIPNEGFACRVEDEDTQYVFNGTLWVTFGSTIDHGTTSGLNDDDHQQYLDITRHDLTNRHPLGTVVPHDTLGNLAEKSHAQLTNVEENDHHTKFTITEHDVTGRHTLGTIVPHDVLASLTEKSHINLTDKGTNTHAEIDTHIGSTSNPHSVTKTQIALTNVTDDSQLKRADGDINSFTVKGIPVSNDILLIEDSAASFAKKKITVGTLPTGGTSTPDHSYYRRTGTTRERWFTTAVTAAAMTVTTALTANRIYAHPIVVPKTITLDQIAVNCTTLVASGKLRLGIYSNSNGEPNSLILDAGEVDTSGTGVKTITINQQLTPDLYWLVAASNSATHAFRVPAIAATLNICGVASTLPTAVMTHFYASFTYNVLPPTFPTVTEGTSLIYPAIFVRLNA